MLKAREITTPTLRDFSRLLRSVPSLRNELRSLELLARLCPRRTRF